MDSKSQGSSGCMRLNEEDPVVVVAAAAVTLGGHHPTTTGTWNRADTSARHHRFLQVWKVATVSCLPACLPATAHQFPPTPHPPSILPSARHSRMDELTPTRA
ncbi:hypothetical protein Pmani_034650 [Petrolisthes manimaculis]|uniref:Uncharacterized protein n=1 Tax=Petrolisthes manimaculis TaxID=1843537 RepID=A0AAE1NM22_9EUCA|nr:hypothetical protein Pmani_034650 [Petrolisthes manimaculis]